MQHTGLLCSNLMLISMCDGLPLSFRHRVAYLSSSKSVSNTLIINKNNNSSDAVRRLQQCLQTLHNNCFYLTANVSWSAQFSWLLLLSGDQLPRNTNRQKWFLSPRRPLPTSSSTETLILVRGNVDNCLGQVKQKVFESLSPWGLFPSGQFYESCSQSTTRHPNTSKRSSAGSNSWASEVNLSIARVKVSALLQRIPRNSLLLSSSIAW